MNRLELLLAAWEDGSLDAAQAAELKRLLADPEARKRLVEDWQFYSSLCAAIQTVPEVAKPAPASPISFWAGLAAWWRWSLAGACAATVALLATWFFSSPTAIARITATQGQVLVVSNQKTNPAAPQQILFAGQTVLVQPGSTAAVAWENEATLLRLGAECRLTLGSQRAPKQLRLEQGQILASVAPQAPAHPLVIATPQAEAVVKGTRFTLGIADQATRLEVLEGAVALRKNASRESITVIPGTYAIAKKDSPVLLQPGTNSIVREMVRETEGRIVWSEPLAGLSAQGPPFGFQTTNSCMHRLRGILTPPASGEYAFWVAASPAGDFWLSTNDQPAGLHRLAGVDIAPDSATPRKSAPLRLEAGRRYYFEARQPFSPGASLAIGWVRPTPNTGSLAEIIGPEFLSPPVFVTRQP